MSISFLHRTIYFIYTTTVILHFYLHLIIWRLSLVTSEFDQFKEHDTFLCIDFQY